MFIDISDDLNPAEHVFHLLKTRLKAKKNKQKMLWKQYSNTDLSEHDQGKCISSCL